MDFVFEKVKKILVLGPHPDDMEFGCLGTVHVDRPFVG